MRSSASRRSGITSPTGTLHPREGTATDSPIVITLVIPEFSSRAATIQTSKTKVNARDENIRNPPRQRAESPTEKRVAPQPCRPPVVPKLCLGMRLAKLCLANPPTNANPKSGVKSESAKRRLGTTETTEVIPENTQSPYAAGAECVRESRWLTPRGFSTQANRQSRRGLLFPAAPKQKMRN